MASEKRKDKKGRILQKGESQLPDGRYMYRYTDMYGKRRKIYSWKLVPTDTAPVGTKDKNCLRELEKEITKDTVKGIDTFASNDTDLNARWELYIAEKIDIKPSTKSNYIFLWEKYVRNKLGQMKLSDITSSAVALFYTELYEENCLAVSTISGVHTLLCPIFDICVEDGLMLKNPSTRAMKRIKEADRLKENDKKKIASEEEDSGERTILTPKQEQAFLSFLYTDKDSENWKNLFVVLLKTGARISEVCGLTKSDIDFKKGIIRIRRNALYGKIDGKCRYYVTSTKKEASTRDFPIYCEELRKALVDAVEKYSDNGEVIDGVSGWIFRNRYGKKPLTESNSNAGLARLLTDYNKSVKDKELKIRDFTCHNFRHTFATKCEEKGVTERGKKALLGHKQDKNDVTNIYVHITPEYIQKEASKLLQDN